MMKVISTGKIRKNEKRWVRYTLPSALYSSLNAPGVIMSGALLPQ